MMMAGKAEVVNVEGRRHCGEGRAEKASDFILIQSPRFCIFVSKSCKKLLLLRKSSMLKAAFSVMVQSLLACFFHQATPSLSNVVRLLVFLVF